MAHFVHLRRPVQRRHPGYVQAGQHRRRALPGPGGPAPAALRTQDPAPKRPHVDVLGHRTEGGTGSDRLRGVRVGRQRPRLHPPPVPGVPGPADCPALALPRDLALFASHLEIRPATDARPLGGGENAELLACTSPTPWTPVPPGTGRWFVSARSTPAVAGPSRTAPCGPPTAGCSPSPARRARCGFRAGSSRRSRRRRARRRPWWPRRRGRRGRRPGGRSPRARSGAAAGTEGGT